MSAATQRRNPGVDLHTCGEDDFISGRLTGALALSHLTFVQLPNHRIHLPYLPRLTRIEREQGKTLNLHFQSR